MPALERLAPYLKEARVFDLGFGSGVMTAMFPGLRGERGAWGWTKRIRWRWRPRTCCGRGGPSHPSPRNGALTVTYTHTHA